MGIFQIPGLMKRKIKNHPKLQNLMRSCASLVVALCVVHAALVVAATRAPTDCAIVLADLAVLPADPRFAAAARINNPLYNASAPAFVAQARQGRIGGR